MLRIIKKKVIMTNKLSSKIRVACSFANCSFEIIEGTLRIIEKTSLAYVEPHRVIIKDRLYIFFNDLDYFYVENLLHKYPLSKLREYIVRIISIILERRNNGRSKKRRYLYKSKYRRTSKRGFSLGEQNFIVKKSSYAKI